MMCKVITMEKDKLIKIKEASEILGVNPETLRRWDRAGKFKAKRHPINGYRMYLSAISNSFIIATSGDPEHRDFLVDHGANIGVDKSEITSIDYEVLLGVK